MTNEAEYKSGQEIYLLLGANQTKAVVEDWLNGGWKCDLWVSRSKKTPGCYVVRTFSAVWAARIVKWHGVKQVKY